MPDHTPNPLDSLKALKYSLGGCFVEKNINFILLVTDTEKTYEDFLDFVYDILETSLLRMQQNSMHYQSNNEPALSEILIKDFSNFDGAIVAKAEASQNGHCDICIEIPRRKWQWLGEAKIHSDYDYLQGGLDQLVKRYSIGEEGYDHGGLIIFIFNMKAFNVIERWREAVVLREDKPTIFECNTRKTMSFITKHPCHNTSGRPYYVKHIGIMLHYKPNDDANKGIKPPGAASDLNHACEKAD